jgi:hypothetical protein
MAPGYDGVRAGASPHCATMAAPFDGVCGDDHAEAVRAAQVAADTSM